MSRGPGMPGLLSLCSPWLDFCSVGSLACKVQVLPLQSPECPHMGGQKGVKFAGCCDYLCHNPMREGLLASYV